MWQNVYYKSKKRTLLSKREEVVTIIKPFFIFLLIFGVYPYNIETKGLKLSKIGIFLHIINTILLFIGYTLLFLGDPFNEFISVYEQLQWSTSAIFAQYFLLINTKKIKRSIDTALTIGSEIIDTNELKKKFRILGVFEGVISLVYLSLWSVGPAMMSYTQDPYFYTDRVNQMYILFYFMVNMEFLVECFYINFFFYLKECFASTNNKILNMVNEIDSIKKYGVINNVSLNLDQEKNIVFKLRKLIKIRQRLLELALRFNNDSSPLILVCSWISLFEIMFSAYYAVVFVFEEQHYDFDQDIFHNYLIGWMVYVAIKFIFMCYVCDLLTNEVIEIFLMRDRTNLGRYV